MQLPVSHYNRYPVNSPEYLKTLLCTPLPPDTFDYQHKKVVVAKKMDRLEYSNRCRMKFIKALSENNREKEKAISCYPHKIEETCDKGLRDAEKVFGNMAFHHEQKMKSVPRRLDIIHDFCVKTEIQASRGALTAADMEPKPTERTMGGKVDFKPINPTYKEFLDATELRLKDYSDQPVLPDETRDPVMSCTLLQPYLPSEPVKEERRQAKAKAVASIAKKKAADKMKKQEADAAKVASLDNLNREMDEKDAMKRGGRK